jgi:hypothetical protein
MLILVLAPAVTVVGHKLVGHMDQAEVLSRNDLVSNIFASPPRVPFSISGEKKVSTLLKYFWKPFIQTFSNYLALRI